jgi:hypothetical protein
MLPSLTPLLFHHTSTRHASRCLLGCSRGGRCGGQRLVRRVRAVVIAIVAQSASLACRHKVLRIEIKVGVSWLACCRSSIPQSSSVPHCFGCHHLTSLPIATVVCSLRMLRRLLPSTRAAGRWTGERGWSLSKIFAVSLTEFAGFLCRWHDYPNVGRSTLSSISTYLRSVRISRPRAFEESGNCCSRSLASIPQRSSAP